MLGIFYHNLEDKLKKQGRMDGQMGEGWRTVRRSVREAQGKLHAPVDLLETLKNFENP